MLPHLQDRRIHAFDLPGFGLSDPHDYSGRSLRRHAVAQVGSMLDALGLERATVVGTSLGAMWALCMALEQPERVRSVVALGIPAVSLAGMRGDPYFRAMTTPGVRALVGRAPAPEDGQGHAPRLDQGDGPPRGLPAARQLLRADARDDGDAGLAARDVLAPQPGDALRPPAAPRTSSPTTSCARSSCPSASSSATTTSTAARRSAAARPR